jgi:hypothetical protein
VSLNQYLSRVFIASVNAPKVVGLTMNELAPELYARTMSSSAFEVVRTTTGMRFSSGFL